MDSLILDLSAYAGLAATVALTINYLFGMLIATGYRRTKYWKKLPPRIKHISVFQWHNRTAYIALSLSLLHPLLLLLDRSTKFDLTAIFLPGKAPTQPVQTTLGLIAFYAFLVVVISSYKTIRQWLSFRAWKNIHLISYGTALLFLLHGLLVDPQLKDRAVDVFDGEKLVSVGCFVLLLAATVLRIRFRRKQPRTSSVATKESA